MQPTLPSMITDPTVAHLVQGQAVLRLAAAVPERVAGWDLVILTAASPVQAVLYRERLEVLASLLPAATRRLVVADPQGRRIGSGGATLHALRQAGAKDLSGKRVLMIHAGGDSRRCPWANVLGKAFVPLPLGGDGDDPPATLLGQILAAMAPLAARLPQGGLVAVNGDVLLLLPASEVPVLTGQAMMLTVPATWDLAGRHGVAVGDGSGMVARLLQKPPPAELVAAGVGPRVELDTGLLLLAGPAWHALLGLAGATEDLVETLLISGCELSLYEEMLWGLVPAERPRLVGRPLGDRLAAAFSSCRLGHLCLPGLRFVHLGSTAEYLEHLAAGWDGLLVRRGLHEGGELVHPGAVLLDSRLARGVRVGAGSLVCSSRLGRGSRVGLRSLVLGVEAEEAPLVVGDHRCCWQMPLQGGRMATCIAGVDDDPKLAGDQLRLANQGIDRFLVRHGIRPEELWTEGAVRDGWQARLHPLLAGQTALAVAAWLADDQPDPAAEAARIWHQAPRASLAELHAVADPQAWLERERGLVSDLVRRRLGRVLVEDPDRNLAALLGRLDGQVGGGRRLTRRLPAPGPGLSVSRLAQVRSDLRPDCPALAAEAFAAVARQVADAVPESAVEPVTGLVPEQTVEVGLPVRLDLAGGWSDTPPWCLERPAAVLNLSVFLDGRPSVVAQATALERPVWELFCEGHDPITIEATQVHAGTDARDPYLLHRQALLSRGFGRPGWIGQGVRLRTLSYAPRGSGLGASSALGAAVVQALDRLAGRPAEPSASVRAVLGLEQRMGSGGGWQDQVGALYPGIKLTRSLPVLPLSLTVEPVCLPTGLRSALERRLVLIFTGQERLARNVLQVVVRRYLRREYRVVAAIRELVELARVGRDLLSAGDLEGLGPFLDQVWRLHQELDPHCSNPAVDHLMAGFAGDGLGWKLAGAGGGGFAAILARNEDAAGRIVRQVGRLGAGVRAWPWRLEAT